MQVNGIKEQPKSSLASGSRNLELRIRESFCWIRKESDRRMVVSKYDKAHQENTDQTDQEKRIWLKLTGQSIFVGETECNQNTHNKYGDIEYKDILAKNVSICVVKDWDEQGSH